MTIDTSTMRQIISNVFDEMLGMPTDPVPDYCDDIVAERVIAAIRISGSLDKLVVVEAPSRTAVAIAENMFACNQENLSEEEILDAVGEVVNMIGGNVKGMFEGESKLSLPDVSEDSGPLNIPENSEQAVTRVSGHPILVWWQDLCPATV
ncbi:MAG: chemotaxis protein CheX [Planctomycetaceae bacterium]|nr:chemotaxis protein CheX [Planctomycetaceae bacterium]